MPAVMAAGFLCSFGCAKKTEADTFVMVDIGYLDDEQYGDDTTFVAITGYATPQPVVTQCLLRNLRLNPQSGPKSGRTSRAAAIRSRRKAKRTTRRTTRRLKLLRRLSLRKK